MRLHRRLHLPASYNPASAAACEAIPVCMPLCCSMRSTPNDTTRPGQGPLGKDRGTSAAHSRNPWALARVRGARSPPLRQGGSREVRTSLLRWPDTASNACATVGTVENAVEATPDPPGPLSRPSRGSAMRMCGAPRGAVLVTLIAASYRSQLPTAPRGGDPIQRRNQLTTVCLFVPLDLLQRPTPRHLLPSHVEAALHTGVGRRGTVAPRLCKREMRGQQPDQACSLYAQ